MSENTTNDGQTQENTSPATSGENSEVKFEPITSQDQLNRIISERVGRERKKYSDYDELKAKATKFDEIEESQKSELEKAQERAAKAEAKALEAELRVTRAEIAAKHSVPAELLNGTNAEELEKSATLLAKFRDEAGQKQSKNNRGGYNPLLGLPPKDNNRAEERAVARALFNRD